MLEKRMLNSTVFTTLKCFSKITRYLEQKQANILKWSGYSSDLNHIKNCCYKVKITYLNQKIRRNRIGYLNR